MQIELVEAGKTPKLRLSTDDGDTAIVLPLSDGQLKAIATILREESKKPVDQWEAFFAKYFVKAKEKLPGAVVWEALQNEGYGIHDVNQFRKWAESKGIVCKWFHGRRFYHGMKQKA